MSAEEEYEEGVEEEKEEEQPEGEEGEEKPEGEEGEEQEEKEPEPPKEVLPDPKEWGGSVAFFIGNQRGGFATLRFGDDLPKWLHYVANDDVFYFKRALAQQADGEGEEEGGEKPPEPAEGDAAEEAEEHEDGAGKKAEEVHVPFDANQHLALEIYSQAPLAFDVHLYTPPPPPVPVEEGEDGLEGGQEGEAGAEGEGAEGQEEAAAEPTTTKDEPAAEEPERHIIDVLTLAAGLSPDCFVTMMQQKNAEGEKVEVAVGVLEQWMFETVAESDTRIVQNLIKAAGELPRKAVKIDFEWLFRKAADNPRQSPALFDVTRVLSVGGVVPKRMIPGNVLRTFDAVTCLKDLLYSIPKTTLQAWSEPKEEEEPEEGAAPATTNGLSSWVGKTLLLFRRFRALKKKGGDKKRVPPSAAKLAELLPTSFHTGEDTVVADPFCPDRPYPPRSLKLYMSDLLLLILATEDDAHDTFTALLERKAALPVRVGDPIGYPELLFQAMPGVIPRNVEAIIRLVPNAFGKTGHVDLVDWAKNASGRLPHMADLAKKHWRVISADAAAMAVVAKRIPSLKTAVEEFRNGVAALSKDIGSATAESLAAAITLFGAENVCTPSLLHRAVSEDAVEAVSFLVRNGVVHVQATPAHEPEHVLKACAERKSLVLLQALVKEGADLNAPVWGGGQMTTLAYIDDHLSASDADALRTAFARLEHDRERDPSFKYGVCLRLKA